MNIRFLQIAEIELDEAVAFYNYEACGLGNNFLCEVLKALDRILEFPEAWQPCSAKARKCLVRRFPYGIIYQIRDNEILVVAIANLHRTPEYWKDRISSN